MDIDARIRLFVPIQRLPKTLQDKAVQLAETREYLRGQVIYAQGNSDDAVYYLLSGTVELLWHGKSTRTLSATNKAALHPLDPPGRKRYSVRALDRATVVVFRRALLERLVSQAEATGSDELEVSEIAAARSSDWMIRMLQSELFSVLPATNIQRIFARMEQVALKADEVVVAQGSPGNYYYVIEQGYCEVSRAIAGGRGHIHLADLGPGAGFGEEALIAHKPRNASVTMLSDGLLMRLGRDDFVELILDEVLRPVDYDDAHRDVADGAVWLDVRYPEEHAGGAFAASENIPVNMLRLQSNRLRKDFRYIICADDIDQAAIGTFLLAERGFDVAYLAETVSAVILRHPELATLSPAAAAAPPMTVIPFPGTDLAYATTNEDQTMDQASNPPYDDTLSRIAALAPPDERQSEAEDLAPMDKYADTATGRELADIIEELGAQHDELAAAGVAPLVRATVAPMAPPAHDAIGALMTEMEARLRGEIAQAVAEQSARLEAGYRAKLARMRELTNEEIRRKEISIRDQFTRAFADKEQLLRSYYKKLIGLANKISKQKSQLQEARKQFELKLVSANQLYREVEEMRQLLNDQIVYMDEQALEDVPPLAMSI